MSRFNFVIPLVNDPFDGTPNLFAAVTNDSRTLVTTLGYINDLAYPLTITIPDFVSPVIPLLRINDILYITTSANGTSEFGSYNVTKVGNSYQLVLNPTLGGIQPFSLALSSIAGLNTAANQMIYTIAPNTYATSPITTLALNLLAASTQMQMQMILGISSLIPSDPSKTYVSAVNSPVVIGQFASFVDINGTIQSSGILTTDVLLRANNLSDLLNAATARINLGLGTAAVQNISFFLQSANNLSDLTNIAVAQANLGLGTAATQNIGFFLQTANNLSDITNPVLARNNLLLGTAATKAASDNTKPILVSVVVPTVINNLAVFSDNNGTISDSGSPIGGFQPFSAALTSIAGLMTSPDLMIYTTASNTYAVTGLTAFSRIMLANPSAATWISTLGLGTAALQNIGFFLQVANNLGDLNNVVTARSNLGLGSAALLAASDITKPTLASVIIPTTINNVAVFADINGTIKDSGSTLTGFQPLNAALTSISALVTSPDQMIYTISSNNYAVTSLTAFSRTLLAAASAAAWQTALGLGSAATQNSNFFLQVANNLSDLANVATARTNLGLGTAALKTASDVTKTIVASVNGATTTGHVATFNDALGTITDGGLLGTSAFKTASSNAQAGVASTSGAFVINNIVVAADTAGTIKDGGSAISGFVPTSRTLTALGLVTGGGDLSANRSFTVTAATQATQEAATSNAVAVTPGSQLYHPSSIKASGTLHEAASPSWLHQYNFTTITRNSAGSYTLTMAVTFSSANYQVVCTPNDGTELVWSVDQKTTTSFRLRSWTLAGILLSDGDFGIMVTGDLA